MIASPISRPISRAISRAINPSAGGVDLNFPLTLGAKLVAWWSGRDRATQYQDSAGTTPVTANMQTVQRIEDKSGNGYHLKRNGGTGDAARATVGYGVAENCVTFWPFGSGPQWTAEGGIEHRTANRRYFFANQERGWSRDAYFYTNGSTLLMFPATNSGAAYYYCSNGQASGAKSFGGVRHPGPRNVWQWRFAPDGITLSNQYFTDTEVNSWSTDFGFAMSGNWFTSTCYFDLFDLIVTTDDLTEQEETDLLAWMRARIDEPVDGSETYPNNLIFFGDSMTAGKGSETLGSWPRKLFTALGAEPRWAQNVCDGQRASDLGSMAAWIHPTLQNIGIFWAGTNDIFNWDKTAVETQTAIEGKITQFLTDGGDRAIVLTCLPRANAGPSHPKEIERVAYNASLIARAATVGYEVIDVASFPEFASSTNLTYFDPDYIHLKDAGQQIIADAIYAALSGDS